MRKRLSVALLSCFIACTPTLLRTPSSSGGSQTGLVRYEYTQIRSIDEKRRRDAERHIEASCAGVYHVLSERVRTESRVVRRGRRGGGAGQPHTYLYIEFVCDGSHSSAMR